MKYMKILKARLEQVNPYLSPIPSNIWLYGLAANTLIHSYYCQVPLLLNWLSADIGLIDIDPVNKL